MAAVFMSGISEFSEKVGQLVKDGIALINEGLQNSIGTTLIEICIQLTATLIIFLIVRFMIWNKVTEILEARKKVVRNALKERDDALKEAEEIRKSINEEKKAATLEANRIIENAKRRGYNEAEMIIENANADAKLKISNANEEIQRMRNESEDEIKKEIIEVAYLMASKIIDKEIKRDDYHNSLDEFIKDNK